MQNLDSRGDASSKSKMKHTPILRNRRCWCFPWKNLFGTQSPAVQDHRYLHSGWAEYLGTYLPLKATLDSQVPENPHWIRLFRWHNAPWQYCAYHKTKQSNKFKVCLWRKYSWCKYFMIRKHVQEVEISPQLQRIWTRSSALQEDALIINLPPRCLFHIFCWIWTAMQAKRQQSWSLHLILFTVSSLQIKYLLHWDHSLEKKNIKKTIKKSNVASDLWVT